MSKSGRQENTQPEAGILQSALNALPGCTAVWDEELRFRYANVRTGQFFGIPAEELTQTTLREVAKPFIEDSFHSEVLPVLRDGRVWSGVLELGPSEGESSIVSMRCDPIVDDDSGGLLILSHFHKLPIGSDEPGDAFVGDSQLAVFLENLPAAAWLKDEKSRTLYANRYWRKRFAPADWFHRTIHDLFPRETAEEMSESDKRALENGLVRTEELVPGADGKKKWYEVWKFPLPRGDQPPLLAGVGIDISERKKARRAIVESEQRFRHVADLAPIMIGMTDELGGIVYFNKAWYEFTSRVPNQELGHGWAEAMHPEDRDRILAEMDRCFRQRLEFRMKYRLKRHDGEYRWVLDVAIPRFDEAGKYLGHVGSALDITEQVLAEQERQASEERLRQARKIESLGVLAAGLAHDFNNLLMGVLGQADLALTEVEPAGPVEAYLEEIVRAANKAVSLSRQMLAYSGRGNFDFRKLKLNDFLVETGDLLQARAPAGIDLRLEIPDEPITVNADATELRQVVLNLVDNALDALERQRGSIHIGLGFIRGLASSFCAHVFGNIPESEQDYAFVEIRDTGTGFPEESAESFVDPFFTTKPDRRGLGLATALGVVRAHGGVLGFENLAEGGSTFRVFLPLARAAGAGESEPARSSRVPASNVGKILLVDDEKSVLSTVSAMLKRLGYESLRASDGVEGLELFEQHLSSIDCVLLDLTMPRMDGRKTLERMKRLGPGIPIVICSGFDGQEASMQLSRNEFDRFLQKPFRLAELADTLEKAIESKKERRTFE